MVEKESFEVIVTSPAQKRYQETILTYLVDNFSIQRVIEIDAAITSKLELLSMWPFSGTKERHLSF